MGSMDHAFARNRAWAERINADTPDFFRTLSAQQTPEYLWIGCADSRVPANTLLDMPPGEVFVHRNIANVVVPSDLNFLSVLQFAVEVLRVKVIILCGHYGCGGVRASMEDRDHGLIDNWLNHIRLVNRLHREELAALPENERADRLCELNVIEQTRNVVSTTIVRNAWDRGQSLSVHGVVYRLDEGILSELVAHTGPEGGAFSVPGGAVAQRPAD